MSAARKYPDVSHESTLEEEELVGMKIDQQFLEAQRAALRRIQSERFPSTRHSRSQSPVSAFIETRAESKHDRFRDFDLNQDEILEQRRIYEQIQAARIHEPTTIKTKSDSEEKESVTALVEQQKGHFSQYLTSLKSDDGVVRDGKRVRIIGESQVYKDISNGDAILVKCITCATFLQVGKKTVNVFCTVCESISPLNRDGLQSAASSPNIDFALASSLQIQEKEAINARIQEKLPRRPRFGTKQKFV